jgi:hypothetical protein
LSFDTDPKQAGITISMEHYVEWNLDEISDSNALWFGRRLRAVMVFNSLLIKPVKQNYQSSMQHLTNHNPTLLEGDWAEQLDSQL